MAMPVPMTIMPSTEQPTTTEAAPIPEDTESDVTTTMHTPPLPSDSLDTIASQRQPYSSPPPLTTAVGASAAGVSTVASAASYPDSLDSDSPLGARIKFNDAEIEKLRVLFMRHARTEAEHHERRQAIKGKATAASTTETEIDCTTRDENGTTDQQTTQSHAPPAVPSPYAVHTPSGCELRLSVGGFVALCTDVCMSTGGVFTRFRERSIVRTIADVGATGILSHALFVADPRLYAFYHNQIEPNENEQTQPVMHPIHAHPNMVPMPQQEPEAIIGQDVSNTSSAATRLHITADLPHTFSFGEFLSHFYYLTKASMEEQLLYHLVVASHRLSLYGRDSYSPSDGFESGTSLSSMSPIPDIFTPSRSAMTGQPTLPIDKIRDDTAAFFCMHIGVLRHIMPLMAYHRAREMRQQMEDDAAAAAPAHQPSSPDAHTGIASPDADDTAITDPGVTVLALLGLLDSVLSEAESAVSEAIKRRCDDTEKKYHPHSSPPSAPPASLSPLPSPLTVPLFSWCSGWSGEAELLALISVPGIATMIQIHSQNSKQKNTNTNTDGK